MTDTKTDAKDYNITEKDGNYFLECSLSEEPVQLLKADELGSIFVSEAAEWTYDRLKRERIFAEWENSSIT
jgi:hypothetical protein